MGAGSPERALSTRGILRRDTTREGRKIESSLLAEIQSRLERLSDTQHRMARNHHILIHAATELRLGKSAEAVLANVKAQSPELLQDYCDIQLTRAAVPLSRRLVRARPV